MRTPLATLTVTMALSLAGLASADVYKCPAPGGTSVYQDAPCRVETAPMLKTAPSHASLRQEAIQATVTHIGQRTLPHDYQHRIDAAMVQRLIDPDSRKIEYVGQVYGSAVCGMVNARNRMGGYTGRQAFVAYFDGTGQVEHLEMYEEKRFASLKYYNDLDTHLFRRCGLIL